MAQKKGDLLPWMKQGPLLYARNETVVEAVGGSRWFIDKENEVNGICRRSPEQCVLGCEKNPFDNLEKGRITNEYCPSFLRRRLV